MTEYPAQLQRQMDDIAEFDRQLAEATAAELQASADPALIQADPAAPAPPEAPPAAPVVKVEDWEAKYKSLQGMFNAEMPRLNSEVRELKSKLTEAITKLSTPAPTPKIAPAATVTAKDVETYGTELVDLIARQARDIVSEAEAARTAEQSDLATKVTELEKRNDTVAERQATNDRATFFSQLTALVPTFEAVNVDPVFLGWLAEIDPMSGLMKQQYLQNAFDNFDVVRTARLFTTWIEANGVPPATPVKTEAQVRLERQVTPSGNKAGTPSTAADDNTRLWTPNEIDVFFRALGRGEYRGNPAEATKIEASIDLAVSQGRVTR